MSFWTAIKNQFRKIIPAGRVYLDNKFKELDDRFRDLNNRDRELNNRYKDLNNRYRELEKISRNQGKSIQEIQKNDQITTQTLEDLKQYIDEKDNFYKKMRAKSAKKGQKD